MSHVMQNIFFGSKIPTKYLDEEQKDLIVNDENHVTSFYNGNHYSGCTSGSLIGIQIKMLDDEDELNLTKFMDNFDNTEKEEEFDKLIEAFRKSDIFEEEEFADVDIDSLIGNIPKPQLFIFPETD